MEKCVLIGNILAENFEVKHFYVQATDFVLFPLSHLILIALRIMTKFKVQYLSKITFYQIFECISLKVLDTGSLHNIRKSMQIRKPVVPKNFKKCLSILLVK